MKFSLLTIHPGLLEPFRREGLVGKAIDKKLLAIDLVNIRDFAEPPHFKVDEKPYGGGAGMVMRCEPIVRALQSVHLNDTKTRTIVLAAKGKKFNQAMANRWLNYDHLVLICGRYEGVDERIAEHYADEEVRIGDYVMMGGEMAAAVIVETVGRLVPGVVGNPESLVSESFSQVHRKEHAQYTRPPIFEGYSVPDVLLKGHHAEIAKWRAACRSKRGN
jgi:tRNA (guanine37-N1)-methyltransferase